MKNLNKLYDRLVVIDLQRKKLKLKIKELFKNKFKRQI